ncbi:MAG: RHS repeat-associated core domain-containing protein [Salibacteraceae bacterium]
MNSELTAQGQQEINAEKSYSGLTAGQHYALSFEVTSIDPTVDVLVDDGSSLLSISIEQAGFYSFNLQSSGTTVLLMVQSTSGKKQLRSICLDNLHLELVRQQVASVVYKEPVNDYRYAFQAQEKDDEVKGVGLSVNYTFRMHDPRLGRFMAVDPLVDKYPELSTYQFSSNKPIHTNELEGLEAGPLRLGATASTSISFGAEKTPRVSGSMTVSAQVGIGNPQQNWRGNFKLDLTGTAYNGGLGVSQNGRGMQWDLSAALTGTAGTGVGDPLPTYTLNYHSKSGIPNEYNRSISFGSMYTFNSTIGQSAEKHKSLGVYRQGLIGFRLGGISVSSNNDSELYGGEGTDEGFTGGIIASTMYRGALLEFGYQSFTGANKHGDPGKPKAHHMVGDRRIRTQTAEQLTYNKAITFGRVSGQFGRWNGTATIDWYTGGWFQNAIHRFASQEYFIYDFKGKVDVGASIEIPGQTP